MQPARHHLMHFWHWLCCTLTWESAMWCREIHVSQAQPLGPLTATISCRKPLQCQTNRAQCSILNLPRLSEWSLLEVLHVPTSLHIGRHCRCVHAKTYYASVAACKTLYVFQLIRIKCQKGLGHLTIFTSSSLQPSLQSSQSSSETKRPWEVC